MWRSFVAGSPQRLERVATIADSLGAPYALPYSFGLCRRFVDEIVRIEDEAMVDAMRLAFDTLKLTLEPAGAAATAALLGPLRERLAGRRVGVLVCGSNIDAVRPSCAWRGLLTMTAWTSWADGSTRVPGAMPADLVIRNARILNVATGTIDEGDVAICGDTIVGTHDAYRGRREIDAEGRIVAPGFIDTHVHIESSLVLPAEFEQGVLPRGTTTAICDPHEIANVLGVAGIRYFLAASESLAMTLRVNLSSCVPATELETAGARLEIADLLPLRAHPAALGLAEVMNFPGVLAKDPGLLAKLAAFAGAPRRRPRAAAARPAAQRLSRRRHPHRPRMHPARRGPREAGQGHVHPDARGLDREERRGPGAAAHRSHLAAHRLLHRRPQSAGDRRGRPHRRRDAHRDRAPARRRWRSIARRRWVPPRRSAWPTAAWWRPGYRADLVLLDDLDSVAVSQVICGGRLVEPELFAGPQPSRRRSATARCGARRSPPASWRRPAPWRRHPGDRRPPVLADHRPSDACGARTRAWP